VERKNRAEPTKSRPEQRKEDHETADESRRNGKQATPGETLQA